MHFVSNNLFSLLKHNDTILGTDNFLTCSRLTALLFKFNILQEFAYTLYQFYNWHIEPRISSIQTYQHVANTINISASQTNTQLIEQDNQWYILEHPAEHSLTWKICH